MMSPRRNPIQMLSGMVGGGGSRMNLSPKQLLTTILVVFSTLSFIKFLLITTHPSSSSGQQHLRSDWESGGSGNGTDGLAAKELALLRSVVAARAPCRILVFGLSLAKVNAGPGAATAFVTDSADDSDAARQVLVGGSDAARQVLVGADDLVIVSV